MPTNHELSFLNPIEFRFTIDRLPNISFTVQKASLPDISISAVKQSTPFKAVYYTADTLEYGEFRVEFIVDQDLKNYSEISDWIIGLAFPENFEQRAGLVESKFGLYSDATLTLMNAVGNPNKEIVFKNILPTSLSEISLDTTGASIQYPICSVAFQHDGFKIKE